MLVSSRSARLAALVPAFVVSGDAGHYVLRITVLDVCEELHRSRSAQRCRHATLMAYVDTFTMHREREATRGTCHP